MSPDGDAFDLAGATRIDVPATELGVRHALLEIRRFWVASDLPNAVCEAGEQVLAEVLNNVVEHAQAGRPEGKIALQSTVVGQDILCCVRDNGAPMPGGRLPSGELGDLSNDIDALPEGGFGWFMIRSLTRDLTYQRQQGWNQLHFRVCAAHDAPAPLF